MYAYFLDEYSSHHSQVILTNRIWGQIAHNIWTILDPTPIMNNWNQCPISENYKIADQAGTPYAEFNSRLFSTPSPPILLYPPPFYNRRWQATYGYWQCCFASKPIWTHFLHPLCKHSSSIDSGGVPLPPQVAHLWHLAKLLLLWLIYIDKHILLLLSPYNLGAIYQSLPIRARWDWPGGHKFQNQNSHSWNWTGNLILKWVCFLHFFYLGTPSAVKRHF